MFKKAKRLNIWKIILFSIIIAYFVVPFARNIVYQISNPNSVYENGSFQCWQFELSDEPCSFIEFLFAEIFGVIFWSIILSPFSISIGLAIAILIVLRVKKLNYKILRNRWFILIIKMVLYLIILVAFLYVSATIWNKLLMLVIKYGL